MACHCHKLPIIAPYSSATRKPWACESTLGKFWSTTNGLETLWMYCFNLGRLAAECAPRKHQSSWWSTKCTDVCHVDNTSFINIQLYIHHQHFHIFPPWSAWRVPHNLPSSKSRYRTTMYHPSKTGHIVTSLELSASVPAALIKVSMVTIVAP